MRHETRLFSINGSNLETGQPWPGALWECAQEMDSSPADPARSETHYSNDATGSAHTPVKTPIISLDASSLSLSFYIFLFHSLSRCVSQSRAGGFGSSWPPFALAASSQSCSHARFYLVGVWVFLVVGLGHCLFFRWFTFACILSSPSAFVGLPFFFVACLFRISLPSIYFRFSILFMFVAPSGVGSPVCTSWGSDELTSGWHQSGPYSQWYMNRILLVPLKKLRNRSKVNNVGHHWSMACM